MTGNDNLIAEWNISDKLIFYDNPALVSNHALPNHWDVDAAELNQAF